MAEYLASVKPEAWAAILTAVSTLFLGYLDRRTSREKDIRAELRADAIREHEETEEAQKRNLELQLELVRLQAELGRREKEEKA